MPKAALDFVLPPRCAACGTQTGSAGGLCPSCWQETRFISPPQCLQCGYPFEMHFGSGMRCGACLADPPDYDRARAAVAYDACIAKILISFKHGDRLDLAPGLARWLPRVAEELREGTNVILPVPLHPNRLRQRKFNQSVLLARPLARAWSMPLALDFVRRHRATPSQGRLSSSARQRNVQGAFRVTPGRKAEIEGKNFLLVDDVMTTGATASALARCLKHAGAMRVDVITLARVVRETRPTPQPTPRPTPRPTP